MKLQLPVELERNLEAVARQRGITVDVLSLQLLDTAVQQISRLPQKPELTSEELL